MPYRAFEIPDTTATIRIPPSALQSEPLRLGYAYWCGLRGPRRYPSRADIQLRDIAGLLRHVSLLKVERGDYIYRVVGDVIVRAYDIPLQNRRLSDLAKEEPAFGTIIKPLLQQCQLSGEPIAVRGRIGRDIFHVTFTEYENVLLPLGPAEDAVDHIMVVSQYLSRPDF